MNGEELPDLIMNRLRLIASSPVSATRIARWEELFMKYDPAFQAYLMDLHNLPLPMEGE